MDPREAMILNLKKRVDILSTENNQLRNVLKLDDSSIKPISGTSVMSGTNRRISGISGISAKSSTDMDRVEHIPNFKHFGDNAYIHHKTRGF